MKEYNNFTRRQSRSCLLVLMICYSLFQRQSSALLPTLSSRGQFGVTLRSSFNQDDESQAYSNLNNTIAQIEAKQKELDLLVEALSSKKSDSASKKIQDRPVTESSQITAPPLKVMLFVDGTWLYYSLHERGDDFCPIVQRYGKGWQFKYNIDWSALPRVLCKALQEQDKSQGWSTMISDGPGNINRPIEVVRVMVFTSYKADTPKHSFRYQMFQEMLNVNYDVQMMETEGKVEKCIDIQLAVDMLHYATVPDAYDIALLLSGDKDYVPAMVRCRQKGRKVGLVSMRSGCNRALRERSDIKDYDVIFLEDYLDDIIKPKTTNQMRKRKPSISQYVLMRIVSDFIWKSGMSRVSSRDIGKYLKVLEVGNRGVLAEIKETYGGLYQFLVVSGIFVVESGQNKAFWVALREDADLGMSEEVQNTKFTASERQFMSDYTLDTLGDDKDKFYWHSIQDSDSTTGSVTSIASPSFERTDTRQEEEERSIDYSTYTVLKLKEVCRERSLPVSGKKADLIERLKEDDESKKDKDIISHADLDPQDYLHGLIMEYLHVKGGEASSRDVGRYLAANSASPKGGLTKDQNTRVSALQELKKLSGSLKQFLSQSNSFEVSDRIDGDVFEFLVRSK